MDVFLLILVYLLCGILFTLVTLRRASDNFDLDAAWWGLFWIVALLILFVSELDDINQRMNNGS